MRKGTQSPPPLALEAASAGELGILHLADPAHVLLAIADGTGPHEGIELLRQRALATLESTYRDLPLGTALTQRMTRAARNASFATYELAVVLPPLRDVAIALTAVAVAGARMSAAHVGDGRVYLRRDGELTQLSKDHTVAAEAEAQAGDRDGPDGRGGERLTRALGRALLVAIDIFEIELRPDDAIVLCSRGVHRVLGDDAIRAALAPGSATLACHALLEQARRMGATGASVGVVRAVRASDGPTGQRA